MSREARCADQPRVSIVPHGPARHADFRTETNLVLIPVVVLDARGRPVAGLSPSNFRLLENGVPRRIESFDTDATPCSIGFALDVSDSMAAKLPLALRWLREFLKSSSSLDDYFLVEFNRRVNLIVDYTNNLADIEKAIATSRTRGRTALLDAIYFSLQKLRASMQPRKVLIILSDGGENGSRVRLSEVNDLAAETDALIYAVGILGGKTLRPEGVSGEQLLSGITERTSGRYWPIHDFRQIGEVATGIALEMHNRYLLGYKPVVRDGKYHEIRVQLNPPADSPPLKVYWRLGFLAPGP